MKTKVTNGLKKQPKVTRISVFGHLTQTIEKDKIVLEVIFNRGFDSNRSFTGHSLKT
jgi:hypothetical protein